jgi:integrase
VNALLEKYPVASEASGYQYRNAVTHWVAYFGDREVGAITAADLAAFSQALSETHSLATVNKIRRHCLALLRWAVELGLLVKVPTWKPMRELKRAPKAFLVTEFKPLVDTAAQWPGWICGVEASAWWKSLLLTIWYSGGRIGAVMHVTWADVLFEKHGLYLRAEFQKHGHDQFFVVGDDCLESLRNMQQPKRALVWPWPYRREALYRHFRKIAEQAGVELGHEQGCCFHRIRKSVASYVRANGGDATAQLGHSCTSVTERYLDPRICGANDATGCMPQL